MYLKQDIKMGDIFTPSLFILAAVPHYQRVDTIMPFYFRFVMVKRLFVENISLTEIAIFCRKGKHE